MKRITLLSVFVGATALLVGCNELQGPATPKKIQQSELARQAAESIAFTENAEIENIRARLELTANPGLLGYVVLLNEMGQPVMYTSVKGKITSSGKRLTPKQKLQRCDKGEWGGECVMLAPSDEGTHGSSSPYIFFWTMAGQYIQWNGRYLYSDKPFRLNIEPLVLGTVAEGQNNDNNQ